MSIKKGLGAGFGAVFGAIVAICAICFFCSFIITLSSVDSDNTNNTTKTKQENTQAKQDTSTKEEPKKETPPPAEKKYTKIFTLKGSSNKKSEPFTITGDKFKVKWVVKGNTSYTSLSINAKIPGKDDLFNNEDITLFAKENGDSIVYKNGSYYLDVISANCEWTIEVYDFK